MISTLRRRKPRTPVDEKKSPCSGAGAAGGTVFVLSSSGCGIEGPEEIGGGAVAVEGAAAFDFLGLLCGALVVVGVGMGTGRLGVGEVIICV
jgi:uncharacterized membrane protein YdcZ (DUF606 family)